MILAIDQQLFPLSEPSIDFCVCFPRELGLSCRNTTLLRLLISNKCIHPQSANPFIVNAIGEDYPVSFRYVPDCEYATFVVRFSSINYIQRALCLVVWEFYNILP